MRVVMLQASLPPNAHAGGVGYQVHLLATELVRRAHDVTVCVVDDPPEGVPYRCARISIPSGRVGRVVGVGRAFARLDLSTYDVVHAHGDDWAFGFRPRVRTFYGSALMEARNATRWSWRCAQLCYYAFEWISSTNPRAVAISGRTRRYLPLVRGVVPCGYDPATFFPGSGRSPDPTILFVAGTLGGRKRGDLLLRAFAEVRRRVPRARLTIVSRDRVVQDGVTCLSDLDPPTLGALYRSSWVLCSTSSYEGFGVPYVEALASGLPVVTTPNDGAREVLAGGLGVLCPPDELAATLTAVLDDTGWRERLRAQGLDAARRYEIGTVAAQYEQLYREAAAAAAGRGRGRGRSLVRVADAGRTRAAP